MARRRSKRRTKTMPKWQRWVNNTGRVVADVYIGEDLVQYWAPGDVKSVLSIHADDAVALGLTKCT